MALPAVVAAVGKAALKQAAASAAAKAAGGGGGDDGAPWGKIIAAAVVLILLVSAAVVSALFGVVSMVSPGSVNEETCILFPGESDEIPADLEDANDDGIGDASAANPTAAFASGDVNTTTVAAHSGDIVMPLPVNTYLLDAKYGTTASASDGQTSFHAGIDFTATEGTPVLAIADGRIVRIVTDDASDGNAAYLASNIDGAIVITVYKFMSSAPSVSVDQIVESGQEIGKVGSTGKSKVAHLHLEVWNTASFTSLVADAATGAPSVDPQSWLTTHGAITLGAGLPSVNGANAPVNLEGTEAEVCILNETGYGAPASGGGSSGGLTNGAWGGFSNGQIPASALAAIPWDTTEMVRPDAQQALVRMNNEYKAAFGVNLSITDSYRSYAGQLACLKTRGSLCAKPGTSNHGWGLAIDFGGGINRFNTPQNNWMQNNAGRFGWVSPTWAHQGSSKPEAWHWEYTG